MDVRETIENTPLFAELPKKDIKRLCGALVERQIPAGTVITEQGQPGVGFFLIASGSATVTVRGQAIRSLKAGDHFGEIALIDEGPRAAEVRADTDMQCYVLPAWQFRAFIKDHPDVAWALMQSLVRQIVRDREGDEQL